MGRKIILMFQSTHETLLAEKSFKKNGVRVRPRVKPREVASDCGYGLETGEDMLARLLELCATDGFHMPATFRETRGKGWEAV